jgi:hypothetical protein
MTCICSTGKRGMGDDVATSLRPVRLGDLTLSLTHFPVHQSHRTHPPTSLHPPRLPQLLATARRHHVPQSRLHNIFIPPRRIPVHARAGPRSEHREGG